MTDWLERAACKHRPDINWFPTRGESVTEAKAVCASCPVQAECLEDALLGGDQHGIRGGRSERERRRLRRDLVRLCTVCHDDISDRSSRALYCDACAKAALIEQRRNAKRRRTEFGAVQAVTAGPKARPLRRTAR